MKALRSVVIDSQLATITALLSLFGLAMVYSAGQTDIKTAAATAYKSQQQEDVPWGVEHRGPALRPGFTIQFARQVVSPGRSLLRNG